MEKHTLSVSENGTVSIFGVQKIIEIDDKTAVLQLDGKRLTIRGGGLNATKLDSEKGFVEIQSTSLGSLAYGASNAIKRLLG